MGWSSKKPWLDDPNSVIERGHYKGRTWQSLMDETLTCGNIFCELGDDGGPKVLTYEEWASDKVEDSPSLWMSRKIEPRNQRDSGLVGCCCHSCSGIISTYRMHYGAEDKERMDEEQIKGALRELLLDITGSNEMKPENLYEMVLRYEDCEVDFAVARLLYHVYGRGMKQSKMPTRWVVLELVGMYYPDVHEEFMNTHFWLLSRRIRSLMDRGAGLNRPLLRHNMKAIDFILKCGIEDWETKRGRALTVDDLIEFGWLYPNTSSEYKSVIGELQTNELYCMFKDVGEKEGDVARSLFGRDVNHNHAIGGVYENSAYSPRGENGRDIETLLTHLEQKVRFRDVPVSDALRDRRGRYVRRRCTFEAITSRFPNIAREGSGGASPYAIWFNTHSKWRDIDFRRRMIAKTVSYLRPNVNVTEDFPHDLSHEDMFKVANLSARMLETVSTWYPISKATRLHKYGVLGAGANWGIQSVLGANWDIETDELVWNHNHTLPELEVYTFLNDMVDSMSMGRARVVMRYRRPLSWAIGNGSKRKPYMCYMDTGMPIVFDVYVPRFKVTNPDSKHYGQWVDECVVEIQGPHHYRVVRWSRGGKRTAGAMAIDESHPEWEKWSENHENIVRHDKIKKRRLGKSIAYIPVCPEAVPVAGVHGDLGTYNFRHVTEENPRKGQHGLAELFEMQDKKTIGSLLREWYGWYQSLRNGVTAS
jgi:hypothetical protein